MSEEQEEYQAVLKAIPALRAATILVRKQRLIQTNLPFQRKQFTRITNHLTTTNKPLMKNVHVQLRVTTKGDKANEHRSEKKVSCPF